MSGRALRSHEVPKFALTVVLLLVPALPTTALAGVVRPWLGVQGALSTFGMSDVNDDIGAVNAALAGTGLSMDEIHGGWGLGVSMGIEPLGPFSVGFGYDRLFASTDVGDFSGSIEYDLPANLFRAFGQYGFAPAGSSGGYLGAALGVVSEAGSVTLSVTGVGSQSVDLHGSSPLFELYGGGEWWTNGPLALSGSLGYRFAKITEIEANGETVLTASGDKYTIDYSGLFLRAGLRFAFAN